MNSQRLHFVLVAAAISFFPLARAHSQSLTPLWDNGLSLVSASGEEALQLGIQLQADGRFDLQKSSSGEIDTLLMRRVRPYLQGRFANYFEFHVVPDFGGRAPTLFDAYFDIKFSAAFRIRAGKAKTPFGLEQLIDDALLPFPERSLATDLVPNRDLGLQLTGNVAHRFISYAGGIFNGVPDNSNGITATTNRKTVVARLVLRPFAWTQKLGDMGLAGGVTSGEQAGALPFFVSTNQVAFFSYLKTAVAAGTQRRISPSAFYYYKSLGAFAEYVRSWQLVHNSGTTDDIGNNAWEVTGTWVATGEGNSSGLLKPKRPFNPQKGRWGALQIGLRTARLTVDRRAFTDGFAAHGSSRVAQATGADVSWFLNANVKYVVSFERTVFDHNHGVRVPENSVIGRLQINLEPGL